MSEQHRGDTSSECGSPDPLYDYVPHASRTRSRAPSPPAFTDRQSRSQSPSSCSQESDDEMTDIMPPGLSLPDTFQLPETVASPVELPEMASMITAGNSGTQDTRCPEVDSGACLKVSLMRDLNGAEEEKGWAKWFELVSPSLGGSQALANAVARGLNEAIKVSKGAAPSVAGILGSAFDRKVYKPFGNREPSFELTLVNGVPTSWMVLKDPMTTSQGSPSDISSTSTQHSVGGAASQNVLSNSTGGSLPDSSLDILRHPKDLSSARPSTFTVSDAARGIGTTGIHRSATAETIDSRLGPSVASRRTMPSGQSTSRARHSVTKDSAGNVIDVTTLEFSGRLWAIGRPSRGTGTQLGIAFSLDLGKTWKKRVILLLEGQVTVQGVLAQLPRASDKEFWPSIEYDQERTRRDLAEWIIEEHHAFMDRGRSNPDPHRQQESLPAADGLIVEATPYSSHEPGLYMATEKIQHVKETSEIIKR